MPGRYVDAPHAEDSSIFGKGGMSMDLYDRTGTPIAYVYGNGYIYLFTGRPVAYIYDNSVYSFKGFHLAWFGNGWIRDHAGACVLFTTGASGGPLKPLRKLKPLKGLRGLRPLKGLRQLKPMRSVNKLGWSRISGSDFFS